MGRFIVLVLIVFSTTAFALDTTRWLSSLPDDVLLSHLSIPGTHESCTLHGGDPVKTQSLSLKSQLKGGIRFFDIRARHYKNAFLIHHTVVFQKLTFGRGVLDVVIDWLKQHPNETVIISLKNEFTERRNNRTYEDTFEWYLNSTRDYWYLGEKIPKLGDVRGKIVLFRRFPIKISRELGIDASNWIDNRSFDRIYNRTHLKIQDFSQVPTLLDADMDLKWKRIESLLNEARTNNNDIWYINFSSGASALAYPYSVSKGSIFGAGMNKRLHDYFLKNPSGRIGTVLMDFPEYNNYTISQIIQRNV